MISIRQQNPHSGRSRKLCCSPKSWRKCGRLLCQFQSSNRNLTNAISENYAAVQSQNAHVSWRSE